MNFQIADIVSSFGGNLAVFPPIKEKTIQTFEKPGTRPDRLSKNSAWSSTSLKGLISLFSHLSTYKLL